MGIERARDCLRAIDAGVACAIGRDRNRAMAPQQSCAGKSILDFLWDELMDAYGWIVLYQGSYPGIDDAQGWEELEGVKGKALGLATAIAIVYNPYMPNVDAVRAEAAERWAART